MKSLNILFVYPLIGNAYELFNAFSRNKQVNIFALLENIEPKNKNIYTRIRYKLKLPVDAFDANEKLLSYNLTQIDIIFIVKGIEIKPITLKKIKENHPAIKLVSWSQDDMFNWLNRSIYYTLGIKYYDLVITQKSYNVEELKSLGAKNVLFQKKAYSRDIHKPIKCSGKYNYDVLFIGSAEKERVESLTYLAENGIVVYVYGGGWDKKKFSKLHENLKIHKYDLLGSDYAEALSCAKISLCFLRKVNRDLQTSRSLEIPACSGFMIAERTNEHLDLFMENEEAVYFETNEELLEKIKFYLANEDKREKIRLNGHKRCMTSNYSYDDRAVKILETICAEVR